MVELVAGQQSTAAEASAAVLLAGALGLLAEGAVRLAEEGHGQGCRGPDGIAGGGRQPDWKVRIRGCGSLARAGEGGDGHEEADKQGEGEDRAAAHGFSPFELEQGKARCRGSLVRGLADLPLSKTGAEGAFSRDSGRSTQARAPDSTGSLALSQPLIPADMTRTFSYPSLRARSAALGALRHKGLEQ